MRAQLDEGAALWFKYADDSPLSFDKARRAGSTAFPELTRVAEVHGFWFPRRIEGALKLSELDEVVLGLLGEDLRSVSKLKVDERLAYPFGSTRLPRRLEEWVRHGDVEQEGEAYRLSDSGVRLLKEGLRKVTDAPFVFVGGCRVNDPSVPWVRVVEPGGWHLAVDHRPVQSR